MSAPRAVLDSFVLAVVLSCAALAARSPPTKPPASPAIDAALARAIDAYLKPMVALGDPRGNCATTA